MLQKIKNIARPFVQRYRINKQLRSLQRPIFIDGFPESKNFGDALNITIVEYLSEQKVFPSRFLPQTTKKNAVSYSVIGSICQWSRPQTVVWGSGFIEEAYKTKEFIKPSKVFAVRGPLTRAVYQANGIDCPANYGDPALLLPLMYNPDIKPRYEYGIIPHYTDWDNAWVHQYRKRENILIINIMISDNYELFVKQIKSCRRIVTSSLHGLILAQAYGIAVCSAKLSDSVAGGEFKFTDYLLSVGKIPKPRTNLLEQKIPLENLEFDNEPIQINLSPLIRTCPFIRPEAKSDLLLKGNHYYGVNT